MKDRSKSFLPTLLIAILIVTCQSSLALTALADDDSASTPGSATGNSPSATAEKAAKNEAAKADEKAADKGDADGEPAPPSAPQSGGTQGGVSGIASRVKSFTRLGPTHESWNTIDLGTKYVRAVFGGLDQGASFGFGIQLTTADKFRFVEFRATALTSAKLYRRFEGEAFFPRVFSEKTHADVWFDYLRRTKDDFFGIGSQIPRTSKTNFDLEQRSYNGLLYHDFSERFHVGGYFSVSNAATYRGQKDSDTPIDRLFSGDPATVPPSRWAPGLFTNAKLLSFGGFAEFDLRDNSRGLTRGAYF